MPKAKLYVVMNDTDLITASPVIYTSKRSANQFIKEFRKRFKDGQGYYSSNRVGRIHPDEVELRVSPYTGGMVIYREAYAI